VRLEQQAPSIPAVAVEVAVMTQEIPFLLAAPAAPALSFSR